MALNASGRTSLYSCESAVEENKASNMTLKLRLQLDLEVATTATAAAAALHLRSMSV